MTMLIITALHGMISLEFTTAICSHGELRQKGWCWCGYGNLAGSDRNWRVGGILDSNGLLVFSGY